MKVREEVQWFAELMETKLQKNDSKPHWSTVTIDYLISRLNDEVNELEEALDTQDMPRGDKILEAVDVANFAMMIADALAENRVPLLPARPEFNEDEHYRCLKNVLVDAYDQAASGKGKERHGQSLPFDKQPILKMSELLSSDAGLKFQAMKKIQESARLPRQAARHELLGAIVYLAANVIWLDRQVEYNGKDLTGPDLIME